MVIPDGVVWLGIASIVVLICADLLDAIRRRNRGFSLLVIIMAAVVFIAITLQEAMR